MAAFGLNAITSRASVGGGRHRGCRNLIRTSIGSAIKRHSLAKSDSFLFRQSQETSPLRCLFGPPAHAAPRLKSLPFDETVIRPCQAGVLVSSLPLSLTTIFGLPLDHQPVRFPRQRQDNCIGLLPA